MASPSQEGSGGVRSTLDVDIQALNDAKDTCGLAPAQSAFDSSSALLTTIRDDMADERDYVDLGRSCADVCRALDRGLKRRRPGELCPPVLEAIEQLTTTVAAIQKNAVKKGKRNMASRLIHKKSEKEAISGWKQDLLRILQIFDTELLMDIHAILSVPQRHTPAGQEYTDKQRQLAQARSVVPNSGSPRFYDALFHSVPVGELPPPAPRACFGRGELVDKVVGIAENLEPIALIGAGGIGKTSIALTVLHDDRIKERFGGNRRFIRCDRFPASAPHFLARLSEVIGAGVRNPDDMAPLRPLLSSKEMIIVLDNAESILDPQGTNHREIYALVDELCQFETVCVCITSRITTVPRYCKRPKVPTLSMEAARDIFYGIYGDGGRSVIIDSLLQRLDFHALSVTLLATTASDNVWDHDRLAEEWDVHRAQVLRTDHGESLAATIELSLASPTFYKLGPNARELLGVVAFFPKGIDEKIVDWLFPTIPETKNILDKFCVLSLAYRCNGFTTMLAPVRDHLRPRDPISSRLLCLTKDHYFARLSVGLDPDEPGFEEARWIKSEDVNVEHLLDVLTSIYADAHPDVWDACVHFMRHLYWQKPRQTVLRSKIESLPDSHPSKARCLFRVSRLFEAVGNRAEQKRLLAHTLALERERGDDFRVAQTLEYLSRANRHLGFLREGIQQAEEGLEIFKWLGNAMGQASCLNALAWLLFEDGQLDAAEDATLRQIDLLPEKGQEVWVCNSHRILGQIYHSKGDEAKVVHHFTTALRIASAFNWHDELFSIHEAMARRFRDEGKFDDANAHIEQAKSHTAENAYLLGCGMEMQASIWYWQCRLEDARSEVLGALEIHERLGGARRVESCRTLLRAIEEAMGSQTSGKADPDEPLGKRG
ncbi:hypothetical protein BJ322DRAFT_559824 [Thelephora terrestris]|uniref:NB-ARC domain-containing protein n=1 Tax=Thelephora terrestris TaxID=56493 RepID=A0A9P6HL88_9AGAM|nr:hypothetical protein BJ322DRAFT_559824 [Thelephora terrestris]